MYFYLFLALTFLGASTGAPTRECELEEERMKKCDRKYPIDFHHWEQKDFPKIVSANLTNVLQCFGPLKCRRHQLGVEMGTMRVQLTIFLAENLLPCFGNGFADESFGECNLGPENGLDCDDKKPFKCIVNKMKEHETCNAKDVEAFKSTFATMVRFCVLWREMKELKKTAVVAF